MKNIKVSIVSNIFNPVGPSAPGGLEVFNYYLAKYLEKKDINVELYASGDSAKMSCLKPLISRSLLYSKSDSFLSIPWNYRRITVEEFGIYTKFIEQQLNKKRILHFSMVNFLPIYLAAKKKLPTVVTLHMSPKNAHFQLLSELLSEQEMENLNFVGVSQQQINDFKHAKTVIQNGVDLDDFQLSINSKDSFIWIGRMVTEKGCDDALIAAKKADVKLEIGGQAKSQNEIEFFNKFIKNSLSEKIIHKGYITANKRSNFYQAKALLFTSKLDEAFGLVIIEAMACGTPVIAYNVGIAGELIKDGKNGFLVKKGDITSLVKAIKQIQSMPKDQYLEMRRFCRSIVEKKYTFDIVADKYIELYKKILS